VKMTDQIENPNKDLIIPDWINEKYFTDVLAKDEPDHLKILKFTPVAAIPPGENFTSTMLRIYINLKMKDGSVKNKTYILKIMLPEDHGGKDFGDFGLFPKEAKMYDIFIPAFEALYKEAGWDIQLAPKCLKTEQRNGEIHFIFEDLRVKGFGNMDRTKGLDMEHMTASLHKLAEYHAASAVFEEKNGRYPEEFYEGFVNRSCKQFHIDGFRLKEKSFKKAMLTWGMKDADKYVEKFPTEEQYWSQCLATLDYKNDEFYVLSHGDFWSSNLMSSYLPDGSLNKLLLIDFQLPKWSHPAEDLLFFLILSPKNELRLKEFDHFVRIYWERLIECLKVLKYKKRLPALRDIQRSMYHKNNSFCVFFSLFTHMPIILFPSEKDSNFHCIMAKTEEGENMRLRMLSNPAFGKIMKDLYPFLYNRGVFNYEDYDV
ncbi:hypothetical protein KR074_000354, partial [Drosophila pseudoananassae]